MEDNCYCKEETVEMCRFCLEKLDYYENETKKKDSKQTKIGLYNWLMLII